MKKFFALFFLVVFINSFSTPFHLHILDKNEKISNYPGEKNVRVKKRVFLNERKKIKEHISDKNLQAILAPISSYEILKKLLKTKKEKVELIFFYPRKKQNADELKKAFLKKKIRKKACKYPKEFSTVIFFSNQSFISKFLEAPFLNFSLVSLTDRIETIHKIVSICDTKSILLLPDPFFLSKQLKKKMKLVEQQLFLSLKEQGVDSIYIKYYKDPKMMRSNFYQTPMLKLNTVNLELTIDAEPGRYFYLINSRELLLSQELNWFQGAMPLHESAQLPAVLF